MLIFVWRAVGVGEVFGQVAVNQFGGIAGREIAGKQKRYFSGGFAGFFVQFAQGAFFGVFADFAAAGGDFQQVFFTGFAILAHHDNSAVWQKGRYANRAFVFYDFALGGFATGQFDSINAQIDNAAFVNALCFEGFFREFHA